MHHARTQTPQDLRSPKQQSCTPSRRVQATCAGHLPCSKPWAVNTIHCCESQQRATDGRAPFRRLLSVRTSPSTPCKAESGPSTGKSFNHARLFLPQDHSSLWDTLPASPDVHKCLPNRAGIRRSRCVCFCFVLAPSVAFRKQIDLYTAVDQLIGRCKSLACMPPQLEAKEDAASGAFEEHPEFWSFALDVAIGNCTHPCGYVLFT